MLMNPFPRQAPGNRLVGQLCSQVSPIVRIDCDLASPSHGDAVIRQRFDPADPEGLMSLAHQHHHPKRVRRPSSKMLGRDSGEEEEEELEGEDAERERKEEEEEEDWEDEKKVRNG